MIVTSSQSAWTTGAVERLGLSLSGRGGAARSRDWAPREATRQLKQTSHAVLDTLDVLVPRAPEAPPPPASLVAILVAGRRPYVGPLRPGRPGLAAIRHSLPSRPNSSTLSRRGRRRTT